MSFELIEPKTGRVRSEPGMTLLGTTGRLTFAGSDLRRAGITDAVAVLVDKSTMRIAIRLPTKKEPSFRVMWTKTKTSGAVSVSAAIAACGLTVKACTGRRELMVKDNLLTVCLV